jgi:hypothetical protein
MLAYVVLFMVLLVATGDFLRSLVIVILVAIGALAIVMITAVFVGGIDVIRDIRMTMRTARGRAPATDDTHRGYRSVVGSRAYLLMAVLVVVGICLLLPVPPVVARGHGSDLGRRDSRPPSHSRRSRRKGEGIPCSCFEVTDDFGNLPCDLV